MTTLLSIDIDEDDLSDARDALARYFNRPADDTGTLADYVTTKLLAQINNAIYRGQLALAHDAVSVTAITVEETAAE